jgi:hypothetical protein
MVQWAGIHEDDDAAEGEDREDDERDDELEQQEEEDNEEEGFRCEISPTTAVHLRQVQLLKWAMDQGVSTRGVDKLMRILRDTGSLVSKMPVTHDGLMSDSIGGTVEGLLQRTIEVPKDAHAIVGGPTHLTMV